MIGKESGHFSDSIVRTCKTMRRVWVLLGPAWCKLFCAVFITLFALHVSDVIHIHPQERYKMYMQMVQVSARVSWPVPRRIVPNSCIYFVHFSLVLVVVVCLCLLGIHEFDFCVSMHHHIWVLLGPAWCKLFSAVFITLFALHVSDVVHIHPQEWNRSTYTCTYLYHLHVHFISLLRMDVYYIRNM